MQHILSLYVGFFRDTSRHAKIRGFARWKLRPEQGSVGHMISKRRKSNRNPQAAEPGLPMNVAPLVGPGGTNPAMSSRCLKWSRWSHCMQFLQVQPAASHKAFALLNLGDPSGPLSCIFPTSQPPLPLLGTALLSWACPQRLLVAPQGPSCRVRPSWMLRLTCGSLSQLRSEAGSHPRCWGLNPPPGEQMIPRPALSPGCSSFRLFIYQMPTVTQSIWFLCRTLSFLLFRLAQKSASYWTSCCQCQSGRSLSWQPQGS